MPDDLARRVHEQLNKKLITPEDELQDALDEMARDIALIESYLVDWTGWVIYLWEQLEGEARRRGNNVAFNKMVKSLIVSLANKSK